MAKSQVKVSKKVKEVVEKILDIPQHMDTLLILHVGGLTPLVVHKWAEKSIKEMQDKQAGIKIKNKPPREPVTEFEQAKYIIGEKDGKPIHGFPAVGFKCCAVEAARQVDGLTMVGTTGMFHVLGVDDTNEFIEIESPEEPIMRTDPVKIGSGPNRTSDLRYRPEYRNWSAKIPVLFNPSVITEESLVNLFNIAGFAVGVGEWRPARKGNKGMFKVVKVERAEAPKY